MVISKYLSSAPQRYPKTGKHIQANKTSLQKSGNITSKSHPSNSLPNNLFIPHMKSKWLQIFPAWPFDSDAYTTLTFLSSSTKQVKKKKKKEAY